MNNLIPGLSFHQSILVLIDLTETILIEHDVGDKMLNLLNLLYSNLTDLYDALFHCSNIRKEITLTKWHCSRPQTILLTCPRLIIANKFKAIITKKCDNIWIIKSLAT